ncbi:MAG: dihydrofolate reductase [Rickettsiales bacterium]|nr:dihydrofolate reductase [Rickettsiales bacterium]
MACDRNGIVGRDGVIPWHYKDEFQHFQNTIGGDPIVMGWKTFEVIPKNILKDRVTIVFSRKKRKRVHRIIFVSSLAEFFSLDILKKDLKIFIIGGAQLANYFLENNLISEFILTIVNGLYDGDAILNIKTLNYWQKKVIGKTSNYNIYKFTNSK